MLIFQNTPSDVAKARLAAWQRDKELRFQAQLEGLVAKGNRQGLDRKRMARSLLASAATIAEGGVGS